jgi:DNA recombination protein RmuC
LKAQILLYLFLSNLLFALALNEDTSLYNKAFKKNIVIVTPATLLATLRTIDSMWTNQKQQNALEIARQAGALYDKFEGFVGDLIKIGKNEKQNRIQWCHEQTG